MSKSAIGLLALTIFATTLAGAPAEVPAQATANISKSTVSDCPSGVAGGSPPAQPGSVCPGIARSFDCKIWPPPIDEDPDRKISGSDGA